MNIFWSVAMILAVSIIIGLFVYLVSLLRRIKRRKIYTQRKITLRNQKLADDIYTIAWAMQQQQCELSEGCLRICVLLDHIIEQPKPSYPALYPGIFALYEQVKDLPTHSARRAQSKQQRRQMDAKRQAQEKKLKPMIVTDITQIIDDFRSKRGKRGD